MPSFAAASSCQAIASPASRLTHHVCATRFPSALFVSGYRSGGGGVTRALLVSMESDTVFRFSGAFEVTYNGFSRKDCWHSCSCTTGWDFEDDSTLEEEIMEFMKTSGKPESFPKMEELVDAGRMDLVEAIRKRGGRFAKVWHLDREEDINVQHSCFKDSGSTTVKSESDDGECQEPPLPVTGKSLDVDSSGSAASSSGSDVVDNEESGVEGILSRLEKKRDMDLRSRLQGKGDVTRARNSDISYGSPSHTSLHAFPGLRKCQPETSVKSGNESDMSKFSGRLAFRGIGNYSNSPKPEMWSNYSIQRAGFSDMEYQVKVGKEGDEIIEACGSNKLNSLSEEVNHNQIRTRLKHLELELSSVLHSVRSNAFQSSSQSQVGGSSSDDLHKLSDAWEFQQNAVMTAQDNLRSIRAKLAALEGKMALAIRDAQKMLEKKQRKIDDARGALQLLRTTSIVLPSQASEILLAGSFDGWTTKRKMQRSKLGVFSLDLKLYPGKYEIKFIVDGKWKVDPLLPIVNSNGHENNLITVD